MVCKSNGIHLVLTTSVNYDGMMCSNSLIFRYSVIFFAGLDFSTFQRSKKALLLLILLQNDAMEFQAMFKKAYKTCVILLVFECFEVMLRSTFKIVDISLYV